MIYTIPVSKYLPGGRRLLRGGVWVFLLLFLLSVYGRWLINGTPELVRPVWTALGPLVLLTDFLRLAFYDLFWFVVLWAFGLIVCTLFWVAGRRARIARIASGAIAVALLAAPFAVPSMYGPYTLRSVDVVQGYELNLLTQPQGYFASAFKSAQREHDIVGCKVRLHGWSGENQLYYGSDCRNDLWRYDPLSRNGPQRIELLPSGFAPSTGISATQVRTHGGDTLLVTRIVEESVSPDGVFRAVVIQDSFYGPFDVIVMKPADP